MTRQEAYTRGYREPLNWSQLCALRELGEDWRYGYDTPYRPNTFHSLVRRGLAEARTGPTFAAGKYGSEQYRLTRSGANYLAVAEWYGL